MLDGATERIYGVFVPEVRQVRDESTLGAVRALVVTNMWPSAAAPQRGVFVRDQVEALRRRPGVEVDVFAFPPGPRALLRAIATIRRRTRPRPATPLRGAPYDVVHAHFGLAALPALAARRGPVVVTLHGNDLFVRRSNLVTRAALPFTALPAAVSRAFSSNLPGAGSERRVAVLPVGIALERFRPIPRAEARERLGLDPAGPYLLFPHDPARPLKRFDRAREAAGDVPLLTLGSVDPDEVPYWINAANAVLVPSQDEGFGLSVIEALACGVPAFGTPVGIHPVALHGIEGAFCEEWDAGRWRAALRPVVEADDPRVDGRARAELFSADRMAARVVEAWHEIAAQDRPSAPEPQPPGLYSAVRAHRRPRSRPTMSGLLRRIKRSRAADAGEPPADQQAAAPEGASTTPETAPAGDEAKTTQLPVATPPAIAKDPERPAGLDELAAAVRRPAGRRGRLRRRLRYLRRARELMLRDLGGLVYEVHRTGGGDFGAHRGVIDGKIERLDAARRRERRDRAGARRPARRDRRVRAGRRRDLRRLRRALRQRRAVLLALRDADRRRPRARRPRRRRSRGTCRRCRRRRARPPTRRQRRSGEAATGETAVLPAADADAERGEEPKRGGRRARGGAARARAGRAPRRRRARADSRGDEPAAPGGEAQTAELKPAADEPKEPGRNPFSNISNGRSEDKGKPPELSSGDPLAARESRK